MKVADAIVELAERASKAPGFPKVASYEIESHTIELRDADGNPVAWVPLNVFDALRKSSGSSSRGPS